MKKIQYFIITSTMLVIMFGYGVAVGHYRWKPFDAIYAIKTMISENFFARQQFQGENGILTAAFRDPVVEGPFHHKSINNINDIFSVNSGILTPQKDFEKAIENIKIINALQIPSLSKFGRIIKIEYRYLNKTYESFAYGDLPKQCDTNSLGTLIIPGSGLNQSSAIAQNDSSNYHRGISEILKTLNGNVYVLIKPNEDFRAWHNGKGLKLSGAYIWNWHLNRFGSYSVSYLVESLAFMKWMKGCHSKTILMGLSQGGAAVLLNALQSSPSVAIVASGYSVLTELTEESDHNQLIGVPGYAALMNPETLRNRLQSASTTWFFSWGKNETGVYKYDAYTATTASKLSGLKSVTNVVHEGDHSFPVLEIKTFLRDVPLLSPFIVRDSRAE
jgi:hypothetical protein